MYIYCKKYKTEENVNSTNDIILVLPFGSTTLLLSAKDYFIKEK